MTESALGCVVVEPAPARPSLARFAMAAAFAFAACALVVLPGVGEPSTVVAPGVIAELPFFGLPVAADDDEPPPLPLPPLLLFPPLVPPPVVTCVPPPPLFGVVPGGGGLVGGGASGVTVWLGDIDGAGPAANAQPSTPWAAGFEPA